MTSDDQELGLYVTALKRRQSQTELETGSCGYCPWFLSRYDGTGECSPTHHALPDERLADVRDYIADLQDEDATLCPETAAAIEEGLDNIRNGRTISLADYRRTRGIDGHQMGIGN
jgi:hypothetical protein